MKDLVVGIDFNNMVYGSYYGEKLINSKGMNVNAIQSFFFKLKMILDSMTPKYMIFANDISREKTFRRKLCNFYKSTRKPTDPDIINQMRYCGQLISLLGYPLINNPYYEADDILGMISKYTSENDMDMIIVSTDKDLYQLINDSVFIFSPRNKEIIDKEALYSKYRLTPDQWIDLKILMGDRSDNIPGIDGIGEISALKLLHEFNNIENIYSHLGNFKPSVKENLLKGKELIPLTRELVTIIRDYSCIDFNEEMLYRKAPYHREIFAILEELDMNNLTNLIRYNFL